MPTFEHTIDIDAPIEHVFDWATVPSNWQLATPAMTDLEIIEETDDGARMHATWKMLGVSTEGEMELDIVEENAHTVTTFDSPGMTGELHYRFSDIDGGTRVVQSADYEFGDSLFERLVEPVASRYNKRQFRNSLETTKELIEAEVQASISA